MTLSKSFVQRFCFVSLVLGTQVGCGIFNTSSDKVGSSSSALTSHPTSLEQSSSLARSSGNGTQIRLAALFPKASESGTFSPSEFSFLNGTGIDASFGSIERPTSPLAQVALRQQASNLCNQQVAGSADNSTIFKTSGILAAGEVLPKDTPTLIAFAAARNIWLDLYTADMPEVQALATLYTSALTGITGATGDLEARRAVCMAAIMAPQFWIGSSMPTDVIRKIAVEVGSRLPTFAEIGAFKAGTLTASAYVEQIQKEPGYLTAVNNWHTSWLGLRPFLVGNTDVRQDASNGGITSGGASKLNGVGFAVQAPSAGATYTENEFVPTKQLASTAESCSHVPQTFDPRTTQIVWEQRDTNPAPPSTASSEEGWNILGAHVQLDGVTQYKARLKQLYFTPANSPSAGAYGSDRDASRALMTQFYKDENGMFAALCTLSTDPSSENTSYLVSENPAPKPVPSGTGSWYACNGAALLPASLRTQLENEYATVLAHITATSSMQSDPNYKYFQEKSQLDNVLVWDSSHSNIIHMRTPMNGIETFSSQTIALTSGSVTAYVYGSRDGDTTPLSSKINWPALNGAIRSPIAFFTTADRRLRRYSPSGEQNGYSQIQLWYSGETVRVCNNVDRFITSCFYRLPSQPNLKTNPDLHVGNVQIPNWNAAGLEPITNANFPYIVDTFDNYATLGYFRCGTPSLGGIISSDPYSGVSTDDLAAYPLGYDYNQASDGSYHYGNVSPTLNSLASITAVEADPTLSEEGASEQNVTTDIQQEPYYLIDYIVSQNLDYRQLITANYTCGHQEMARYYGTQGYYLPISPTTIDPNIDKVGDSCATTSQGDLFKISHKNIQLPVALLRNSDNSYHNPLMSSWTATNAITGITGQVMAMPDPRAIQTIPERVMSGILTMPAFMAPVTPKVRSIAARYFQRLMCGDPSMFVPNSAQTAMQAQFVSQRKHLEPECISCHINLDPLSSALSTNFDAYEGTPGAEAQGEMADLNGVDTLGAVYGVRAGAGAKGAGAFLGQQVTGVEALGQSLANSDQFASCVVQTTFQNVFGRAVDTDDAKFVQALTTSFETTLNYNYNKLVEQLVISPEFLEKE